MQGSRKEKIDSPTIPWASDGTQRPVYLQNISMPPSHEGRALSTAHLDYQQDCSQPCDGAPERQGACAACHCAKLGHAEPSP